MENMRSVEITKSLEVSVEIHKELKIIAIQKNLPLKQYVAHILLEGINRDRQ